MLERATSDYGTRAQETRRVARILEIIWRVSARPCYWTRKALASDFEVSERTITTDIEIIRHRLRFDMHAKKGEGYYFDRVPQLPAVTYSVPEALALVLAAESGRHTAGIYEQDLNSAIARLESVFPGELGQMMRRHSDAHAAIEPTHRERMLQLCGRAVLERRTIHLVYATASRAGVETHRDLDPYAVFPYARAWHVLGYCRLREEVRVFKIDRIRSAEMTKQHFSLPLDFDVSDYLNDGWGLMRGLSVPVEQVELCFSATAARWVIDEAWHPTQELHVAEHGELTFRVEIQVTPEFQRWVFGFGRDVQVVAPAALRDWVRQEALALVATEG